MPEPIGTNEEGAIAYLGCSRTMFEKLRQRGYFRSLRKGWYSYKMLAEGMARLIQDTEEERVLGIDHQDEPAKSAVVEGKPAAVPSYAHRSTKELLRSLQVGRARKGD